jgi:hypothetical protein
MKTFVAPLLLSLSFAAQADEAAIRQAFGERYGNMPIKSVTATAMPGLYEVFAGGRTCIRMRRATIS